MKLPLRLKENLISGKNYVWAFLSWVVLGIIIGILCGILGGLFSKSIFYVTQLRNTNSWIIYTLPFLGLIIVGIYKLCKVTDVGTNEVFESVRSEKPVPFLLLPAIFLGSVLTHLGGGSAGKEGAALQLGGSVSSLLARILHLDERTRHILTMCGMGALFSGIFGTPLGACVFAIEVVRVGHICSAALLPALISSVTAFKTASYFGVSPEKFELGIIPDLNLSVLWRVVIIAIICAIVSTFFCLAMNLSEHIFKKLFKNPFIRVFVGGVVIIILTLLVGTNDYNGGDISVINRVFTGGNIPYEAFLLKIIFTAITIGCGYKGGEIIPTLFIGTYLGASLAGLFGLNPAFCAAIGMAALFCGVTNCPLATCFISIELFGSEGLIFFALSAIISFILSGKISLYKSQKLFFSKITEEVIDKD